MLKNIYSSYYKALYDTDAQLAHQIIAAALEDGVSAQELILKIIAPSMEQFAEDFVDNTVTLAQHFLTSSISSEIIEELLTKFHLEGERKGVVIIGTAAGDFHGLGKKIVSGFLKTALFEVIDLGINVSPDRFFEEAKRHPRAVIGVSSMMVHTALSDNGAAAVRNRIESAGAQSRYKLIVGGAPYKFDETLWQRTGADCWAVDGSDAVKQVKQLFAAMEPT